MKTKVGRPSTLTPDLLLKIKQSILDGNNLLQTSKFTNIDIQTIYAWHGRNYHSFADKVEGWKRDRKLMLAEKNIEEFLLMSTKSIVASKNGEDLVEVDDVGKLRVKADISKFVAQTLGRDNYAVRQEITGADGDDIKIDINNKEMIIVIQEFEAKIKEKIINAQGIKESSRLIEAGKKDQD